MGQLVAEHIGLYRMGEENPAEHERQHAAQKRKRTGLHPTGDGQHAGQRDGYAPARRKQQDAEHESEKSPHHFFFSTP